MTIFYRLAITLVILLVTPQLMAQCPVGQWPVGITIIPDDYPGETTWNLYSNGNEVANGNVNGSMVCVDTADCIRFDIHDSYGDGICCGYGIGSYVITLNGTQVASGGQFAFTASHSFNCGPGTICENPIPIDTGVTVSPQENLYYSFTPDTTGIFTISTCNLSACDTRIWVYNNCANVDFNGSATGALYYNDDNALCGLQADLHPLLTAGVEYIIKIGLKANTACAASIPFSITYEGAMTSVLPIIKLTTVNNAINNDVKVPVVMEIIDNGPGLINSTADTIYSYEGTIMTEWQGFTGPGYPKKNYDFDLVDANGNKIDTSLLGMPAENDWIFKAEYLDNSLLVNTVTYEFSRRMRQYAPRTRQCEVFLDGTYIGVYTLTEKVKRDNNRLDIAKMKSADTAGSELTGGYIIEMNINGAPAAWNSVYPPINSATSPHAVEFKYVYPKADSILPVQANYIKTYVDSFENALNGTNYANDTLGYRKWIDVGTFIDFLIVNEFSMNYDSYGRSTYMYKEKDTDGNKLCIGPPWDYDRAMANDPNSGWVWENTHPYWPFPFWWSKLYTDSVYRHELACRWFSLREDVLKTARFMAFIDSVSAPLLQGPADRNFAVWQTLGASTYNAQVQQMKVFLYQRLAWIDNELAPFGAVLPNLTIPSDTSVCKGITYTAPYNPSYTYNWIPGPEAQSITLNTPGTYNLRVKDDFGCQRTLPMTVSISEPDSTFTQGLHVAGDVYYIFTGNNGTNSQYLWDFGDQTFLSSGQTVSHIYATPGIYDVHMTVIDTLGCIGESTKQIQITDGEIQVGIQPNPSVNNPIITHNIPQDETFSFSLYDAAGRKLKEIPNPASPFTIETSGMAEGTYWLQCSYKGQKISKGIIVLN
ncbi:MAG: hypothetical protein RL365_2008 [Bacteroidota bacterium]|jgi:hypothetical protein